MQPIEQMASDKIARVGRENPKLCKVREINGKKKMGMALKMKRGGARKTRGSRGTNLS